MAAIERTRSLRVLMADQELAMVHSLAEADGVTVSDVVRTLIRRAHADRFDDKKTKTKR